MQCDEGAPCSGCTKDAAKIQHMGCDDLAEQICFRQQPTTAFSEINRIICKSCANPLDVNFLYSRDLMPFQVLKCRLEGKHWKAHTLPYSSTHTVSIHRQ